METLASLSDRPATVSRSGRKSRKYGEYLKRLNNTAVALRWAARDGEYAVSEHLMFRGPSIYSYGVEIGRWIGDRAVVLSTHRWSVSTANHQTLIRSAIGRYPQVEVVYRPNIVVGFTADNDVEVIRQCLDKIRREEAANLA